MVKSRFLYRYISISFLLLLGSLPVFSVQYWGDGVFADFGYSAKYSVVTPYPYEGGLGIRKTFDQISLFSGLWFDEFAVEGTVSYLAYPLKKGILKTNRFRLGFGYLSHFSRSFPTESNPNILVWNNLFSITALLTGTNSENPFVFLSSIGINAKESFLYLSKSVVRFHEAYPTLEFRFTKRFLRRNEVMFRFATFDPLYFRGFLNTWWQLGYSFDITSRISSGILLDVMYADQITLSGTISGLQGKIFVVYRL